MGEKIFLGFKEILSFKLIKDKIQMENQYRCTIDDELDYKNDPNFYFAELNMKSVEMSLGYATTYMINNKVLETTVEYLRKVSEEFSLKASGFDKEKFDQIIDNFVKKVIGSKRFGKCLTVTGIKYKYSLLRFGNEFYLTRTDRIHKEKDYSYLNCAVYELDSTNSEHYTQELRKNYIVAITNSYIDDNISVETMVAEIDKFKKNTKKTHFQKSLNY